MNIIGRLAEQKILSYRLSTPDPELIAVYGRRRVGKTYLVRTFFADKIVFEFSGIHESSTKAQLENFSETLQLATGSALELATPKSWLKAFTMLSKYLNSLPINKKAVVFFDEFPWIDTPRSGFLQAFDHWWNVFASRKPQLKVIICGSAASWMIDKIINNRGGLHNRVTQTIRLLPFTLMETQEFLNAKGIVLDLYSQIQLYMALGGIPHYLKSIIPGESTAQIIDRLCFAKDGPLKKEFKKLYKSLFANSEHHEAVVRALADKGSGLTRKEIIVACGFTSGGTTSRILEELKESGFISAYIPFDKKTYERIYKLSDEYTLFYFKFIERGRDITEGAWLRRFGTPTYVTWCGLAFESVCQKHVLQIKRKLGIEGVLTNTAAWRHIPEKGEQGAQIDLLLDRSDRCINICEMKFKNEQFVIDKKYAADLNRKVNVFRRESGTKKTLFLTLITTFGTRKNEYYLGQVQAEVLMEDLFK